mgnify:FL=1
MVFYGLLDNLCASLDAYVCDDGYVCHDTYIVVMVFVVRMILIYVVYVYFIIYICCEFELKANRKKEKKLDANYAYGLAVGIGLPCATRGRHVEAMPTVRPTAYI